METLLLWLWVWLSVSTSAPISGTRGVKGNGSCNIKMYQYLLKELLIKQ
jgi:hypothetical protein